ncbi:uncharacterized protein yc1106_09276 [Curvularia clavata]|uniref:DUF676 domain-containing protein n=1 Tax=Curvularia clavata TaxID=95742 RepID=A0A9Q8ZET7_CURCL|nr:uncharacterized protein yc1106_09276 [Curvularia clavata]
MAMVSTRLDPNEVCLKLIANPDNALLDIIAVHGMNPKNDLDHPNKTWTHQEPQGSGTNWLRDLLPPYVPRARIMMYQYNANIAFGPSTAGVQEQAENLLQLLSVQREHARSRPIIFIAHSMGGIIVKQALATAYSAPSGEYAAIYIFTFALFLFGVPHRGSNVPRQAWVEIPRKIFQLCGYSIHDSFLSSVTEGSNYAEQLQNSFKPLLGFYNVFTVCETIGDSKFGIKIVPKESAELGAFSEVVYYPNRTHRTICKFRDSNDDVWQHVSDMLSRAAERAVNSTHYSPISDTRKAMLNPLSTNLEDTQFVDRQIIPSITQVIEQAQKITKQLRTGPQSAVDLEQIVQAQTTKISSCEQAWSGIISAVLLIISGPVALIIATVMVRAIKALPSPVVVSQEAERGLERQQKIVDLTKQTIEVLNSECNSAVQTHNTLQTFLVPETCFNVVRAVNQLEQVRPLHLDLDREIAASVQKLHKLIYRDLQESERRLELIQKAVEKVKSLENGDEAEFWMQLAPYVKENMEAERQNLLETGTTGTQEDETGCCVIL